MSGLVYAYPPGTVTPKQVGCKKTASVPAVPSLYSKTPNAITMSAITALSLIVHTVMLRYLVYAYKMSASSLPSLSAAVFEHFYCIPRITIPGFRWPVQDYELSMVPTDTSLDTIDVTNKVVHFLGSHMSYHAKAMVYFSKVKNVSEASISISIDEQGQIYIVR